MSRDEFILREFQGVPYYCCRPFEQVARLRHGFSTRHGGLPDSKESSLNLISTSWDSPERVNENRRRFLSALKLGSARLVTLHQVHSDRVHIIKEISDHWNQTEGDALVTQIKNVVLAVQIADCLPVLIADPARRVVAAVHSGWRGTLSGVLLRTLREMNRAFGSTAENLLVAVGPGIRSCCFEVGPDVAGAFDKKYPEHCLAKPSNTRPGKFLLDLPGALEIQLNIAGVPVGNRHDLGACTCCNTNEFFSYRAEGSASGRMMAAIAIGEA